MNQLSSAWTLFKQAWGLFQSKWQPLVLLSVLPAVFALVLGILGVSFHQNTATSVIFVVLAGIIIIYLAVWFELGMVHAVTEDGLTVSTALSRSKNQVGKFFWTGLVTGIAIAFGFVLLIVPGIIFAVWYSLVSFVFVCDNLSGFEAMHKSKEYVKGHWGAVAWRLVFLFIVFAGLSIIGSVILGSKSDAYRIYSALVSMVLGPIGLIYEYLIYKELRQIKEQPGPVPSAPEPTTPINPMIE